MRVHAARFIAGAARSTQLPADGALPEIAFAGRSNVGKSSLLNRLTGRHALARVSKTPGRTQQINFFAIDERLIFVDLPGYGFARVPLEVKARWRGLVESYMGGRRALRGVVVIIDVRRGIEGDDGLLLEFLDAQRIPAILVAGKIDKIKRNQRAELLGRIAEQARDRPVIPFSSATGEGTPALWGAISALAGAGRPRSRRSG